MIIFDLDGTLADCTHRLHFIQGEKKRWTEFFAACPDDKPIAPVINCFNALARQGQHIEVWSGRSDEVFKQTDDWLFKHVECWGLIHACDLRMRPAGNHIDDHILKERWLDEALAAGKQVTMVFDDRRRIVDMWRRRGIVCLQVAPGEF